MRILVVTTFYAPDLGPGAALFTMLCEDLVRLGHEVCVMAAVPHYPTGHVPQKFRTRLISREWDQGVEVIRVRVPSVNRRRLAMRLLTFMAYQLLSTIGGIKRKYDVVIAGNPALEVFLPFWVLAVLRKKPAIFSVHDLYPEVGVRLGVFRHHLVIGVVRWMENFCLKRANRVRVLSEGFRENILTRGIPAAKILLVYDWLDTDFIQPLPRNNALSSRWELNDRFVVLYAGNIGLSQGLESVLDAAVLLSSYPGIEIVLVGDGAEKDVLQERASRLQLDNVRFLPFQPREDLPDVLASADVSLVCLKHGVSADSVPSKFYSILASARPVVAAVDPGSDSWRLVEIAGCGLCVEPENPSALAAAILTLFRDESRRSAMGQSGRRYVVANHGRTAAAQLFHEAISALGPAKRLPDQDKDQNSDKELALDRRR